MKANQINAPIKVKDFIEHLKTLPQDLEVWIFWDESGECWPEKEILVK